MGGRIAPQGGGLERKEVQEVSSIDVFDMEELEASILARGFIPRRIWRLYREVMGDHGTGLAHSYGARSSTCPVESRRKECVRTRRYVARARCCECGGAIRHFGCVCPKCGADTYYSTILGLNSKKGGKL